MKLVRTFGLIAILGASGSLFSQPNLADSEAKGFTDCNQARAIPTCTLLSVNEETPKTDAAETEYASTPASEKTRANPADVSVSYRYSGPLGDGRTWPLDNGSTMASGDQFKVFVEFNQTACVYLMHFDSHGQVNDLMTLGKQANCQPAGTRVILPAENKSFSLDDKTGQEVIHTIASLSKMTGLKYQYQDQIKRISQGVVAQYHQSKGVFVTVDAVQPGQARSVVCPGTDACRDEFVIQHVARR